MSERRSRTPNRGRLGTGAGLALGLALGAPAVAGAAPLRWEQSASGGSRTIVADVEPAGGGWLSDLETIFAVGGDPAAESDPSALGTAAPADPARRRRSSS